MECRKCMYGYGIQLMKDVELSMDKLAKSLGKTANEKTTIADILVTDEDLDKFIPLKFRTIIYLEKTDGQESGYYLLYEPNYPWYQKKLEANLTEKMLDQMFLEILQPLVKDGISQEDILSKICYFECEEE